MRSEGMDIKAICLQLLDSVMGPRSAAYVSGPLDTGRIYYELLAKKRNPTPNIRKKNQERLTRFAQQLRRRVPYPVIDPGPLRVHGWTGPDYGSFFLEVLKRHAKEVWFTDGWEFSTGATKEFIFCVSNGVRRLTQSGAELTPEAGKLLIAEAVSFVDKLGLDSSKLRSRIESLEVATADMRPFRGKVP